MFVELMLWGLPVFQDHWAAVKASADKTLAEARRKREEDAKKESEFKERWKAYQALTEELMRERERLHREFEELKRARDAKR